jgi:hypothetical protein
MRKWERELKEIPGVMSLEMGGKHIKLRLSNSRTVFCSSSPSDINAIRNATRQVQRELKWVGVHAKG